MAIAILIAVITTQCTWRQPSQLLDQSAIDISADLAQAANLQAERRYSAALNVLRQTSQVAPQDARPYIAIGQIYLAQHRWSLAQDAFSQALRLEAANFEATVGLATTLLGSDQIARSLNSWEKALVLDDSQTEAWIGLGRAYLADQQYDRARTAFEQAHNLAANPETQWYVAALTIPTDFAAGMTYLREINPATEQSQHLSNALAQFSDAAPQAEVAKISGIALTQLEAWPLAHQALLSAVELDPSDAQSWVFLGYTQSSLGLPALDSFTQARTLSPDLALIPYFEGLHLRQNELYDLAIERFLEVLEVDPENLGAALETARTLEAKRDFLSAEAWYLGLVEADPDTTLYQEFLTAFYVENSYRVVEAGLTEAEKLVTLAPNSARAYDLLGWARFQNNDFTGAETALNRAIELDSDNISARYHLGQALKAQRRNVDAEEEFTRVIDWDTSGIYRDRVLGSTIK